MVSRRMAADFVRRVATPTLGHKLEVMRKLAQHGADLPTIQGLARMAISGVALDARPDGLALALATWVRSSVVYTRERGEVMLGAEQTLSVGAGDCDDHAICLATLALALGMRARFLVSGPAGVPAHVWAALYCPGARKWIDLDTTLRRPLGQRSVRPGWSILANVEAG